MRIFVAAVSFVISFCFVAFTGSEVLAKTSKHASAKHAKATGHSKVSVAKLLLSADQVMKLKPDARLKYMRVLQNIIVDMERELAKSGAYAELEKLNGLKAAFDFLIPQAQAALTCETDTACIFAGWPSKCSGGKCTTPAETSGCPGGGYKCSPMFGYSSGSLVCTPAGTPANTSSIACRTEAAKVKADFTAKNIGSNADSLKSYLSGINGTLESYCPANSPREACGLWKTEIAKVNASDDVKAIMTPAQTAAATEIIETVDVVAPVEGTPENDPTGPGSNLPPSVPVVQPTTEVPGGAAPTSTGAVAEGETEDPNCQKDKWVGTSKKVKWPKGGSDTSEKPNFEVKCLGSCNGNYVYIMRNWDLSGRNELIVNRITIRKDRFGTSAPKIKSFEDYIAKGDFIKEAPNLKADGPRCEFLESESRHNKALVPLYEKYLEQSSNNPTGNEKSDACLKGPKLNYANQSETNNLSWDKNEENRILTTAKGESTNVYSVKFGGLKGAKSLYVESSNGNNSVDCKGTEAEMIPLRGLFFNYLNNRTNKDAGGVRCPQSWSKGVCSKEFDFSSTGIKWGGEELLSEGTKE